MKKKQIITAAGCLLMLAVTACGKETAETANTTSAQQAGTAGAANTAAAQQAETKAASGTTTTQPTGAGETASAEDLPPKADGPEHVRVILDTVCDEIYFSDTNASSARTQYVEISLDEETAAKYPELAKALSTYSKNAAADGAERLDELRSSYEEMKEYGAASVENLQLSDVFAGTVLRADSNVVSIFLDYSSYWGGAHGMYGYSGANFDPRTGKELLFTDVVKDTERFFDLADEKLRDQYPDIYEYLTDVKEFASENDLNDMDMLPWSIDSEGVTVYFNPYTLGAYAMGAQILRIPFEEAPEIFEECYTEAPASYVIPLHESIPLFIDADGNGTKEALEILSEADESERYAWIVKCGNRSVTVDDYCYSMDGYLVRANDQYYLYIFEVSDNDYQLLATVDLKTMIYDPGRTVNAGLSVLSHDWNGTGNGYGTRQKEYGFSDPAHFELQARMDLLSTMGGSRQYHVGSDGYPASDDEWYRLNTETVLQAKQDVSCEQVDLDGAVITRTTLPKGTYVFFVRTDGREWVDVQEIDASVVIKEDYGDWNRIYTEKAMQPDPEKPIYRIHIDASEYPHMINGIEEDQMFDGIMYAG